MAQRERIRRVGQRFVALILILGMGSCDGEGTPVTPPDVATPGVLNAVIVTAPTNLAALSFELVGSAMSSPRSVSSSNDLWTIGDSQRWGVVAIGDLGAGGIVSFDVPDTRQVRSYSVRVVEVALDDLSVPAPSSVTMRIE